MAIDAFMYLHNYDNSYIQSEAPANLITSKEGLAAGFQAANEAHGLFELEDFSFDVEQVLNIGSQSTGAGAGRITFNPFSITRKIDVASPVLFGMSCSGTPVKDLCLGLRRSTAGKASEKPVSAFFLKYTFKLAAVKTISWADHPDAESETITFEYGGLIMEYSAQKADGTMLPPVVRGWNRVRNVAADVNTVVM